MIGHPRLHVINESPDSFLSYVSRVEADLEHLGPSLPARRAQIEIDVFESVVNFLFEVFRDFACVRIPAA